MIKKVALKDIRTDGKTQQRDIDDSTVARYKALMEAGVEFPPVEIISDGKNQWLWDGFTRYHARRKTGKNYIMANVEEGTKRDARWNSFSANAKHGVPRKPGAVKEMLFDKIFPDAEWGALSDTDIANWIGGVTRRHVSKCREEYEKAKDEALTGQDESTEGRLPSVDKKNRQRGSGPKNEDSHPIPPEPVLDSVQKEVPEHLQKVFQREDEIKRHIKYINQMVRDIKKAQEMNDLLWVNCKFNSLKSDVGNLRRNLRFALPYCVCVYCGGDVNNEDCTACNGHGFLNELQYTAAPKEMK